MKLRSLHLYGFLLVAVLLVLFSTVRAHEESPSTLLNTPEGAAAEPASQDQSPGAVKGLVRDKQTKAPLAGVNIIVEGTRQGTMTDQDGVFLIENLSTGTHTLVIDFIGYAVERREDIIISADQTFDLKIIELEERPIPLREIVVSPGSYSLMGGEATFRQTLTSEDIKIMGWAEDITRAIQRIPGISAGDFSAKFSIRGGDVDEVLVLLDGMQIYKPFHQKDFGGGILSTVDIETVEGVDLLTGGFAADYGDRMSGVLNMTTKTARPGERQTSVGFSLLNARLFTMGKSRNGKGSWLFSARRGYLDLLNSLMKDEFKLRPFYYDLFGKLEYQLNAKHQLSVYGFLAKDAYKLDERIVEKGKTTPNIDNVDTKYGNNYGWMTLKSFLSKRLYVRTMLYGGSVTKNRFWNQYDDDPNSHLNTALIDDNRDLTLVGLKQDWDYEASGKVLFKLGLDVKRLTAKYRYSKDIRNEFITASDSLIEQMIDYQADKAQNGNQLGLFFSSRFKLIEPLTLEAGMRYDHASYSDDHLWSPRIGLAYALAKQTTLRAGWGYFYQSQGIDELDIQYGDLTYSPAQLAEHFVLGFQQNFSNGLQFRAEGYVKRMSDLQDIYYAFRDIDEFFPESRDDLVRLSFNKATAKGIELFAKYDTGKKVSWWLSYVLSEATDDVAAIDFDGKLQKQTGSLPRAWDQRHTVNLDMNYRLSKKWQFNVAWQYRSGWPTTDFTVERKQRSDGTYAYYHDYGLFRDSRLPSYQRLDTRINRHFFTSKGKISVYLHVINLYNHENVISYDHEVREENAQTFRYTYEPETFFGILPFAGVSWEF